ncbi:unnamed protein product [Closterium sp. Naga37s-1]|nr:unnamed protein product [Closterium sp. Naga37s-1]
MLPTAAAPATVTIEGLHGQLVTFPADSEALHGGQVRQTVGGDKDSDEDSDSEEEGTDDDNEEAGGYQQLPFEPVLVGGDAEATNGYEQADAAAGVGIMQAYSGAAVGDMQAEAGGAHANVQFDTGAAAGNAQAFAGGAVQFFAGAAAGNAQGVAGAAEGNAQVAAANVLPTKRLRSALHLCCVYVMAVPDVHHATMNRNLVAEMDDMRNTMAILQENHAATAQIEQERDALRGEVAVLHAQIRMLQSRTIDGVEAVDFDNPQIDVEKLPKVDGKIHIPTILSDDEVFAVEWPMAHWKGQNSPSLDTVELNNRNCVTEKTAVCASWLKEWLERDPAVFKADVPQGFEMGTAYSGKDKLKVRILIEGWKAYLFPSGVPQVEYWPPA